MQLGDLAAGQAVRAVLLAMRDVRDEAREDGAMHSFGIALFRKRWDCGGESLGREALQLGVKLIPLPHAHGAQESLGAPAPSSA